MNANAKRISPRQAPADVAAMVEDVIGCKWSLRVLEQVRGGTRRPGAIESAVPGLSQKVLNERLRKLTRFGVLEKVAYPEVPPRVEYFLTEFGQRFADILDRIRALEAARLGRS